MNELDNLEDAYFGKKPTKDEKELVKLRGLFEHCWVMKPPKAPSIHVPYNLLAFLVKMAPKENTEEFLEEKLRSYGYLQTNQHIEEALRKRVQYAFNWTQDFAEIKETAVSLTEKEEKAVSELIGVLETVDEPEKIQNAVFNVAKINGIQPGTFFKTLYMILMGAPQGPRLGPYILAMGKQNVIAALKRALAKP